MITGNRPYARPSDSEDPELKALWRQQTALSTQLRKLTSELDSVNQALKIESSAKDEELTRLITLWRAASRQAAEEIFAGVRDRINRMGGVAAWKETERNRMQSWGESSWNNDSAETSMHHDHDDASDGDGVIEERTSRFEDETEYHPAEDQSCYQEGMGGLIMEDGPENQVRILSSVLPCFWILTVRGVHY